MNEMNDRELGAILKKSIPAANRELQRDLWPSMLRRLEKNESSLPHSIPWFDWVLLGAMVASVLLVPQMIPMLLYHL
jgi:hypothetical protein